MPADAAAPTGPPEIALADGKPYRKALERGGRAHVDRPLPFLILHRSEGDATHSLARHVAATGSAYVTWPAERGCDAEAAAIIGAIARAQRARFPRVLLVSLHDLPRDESLDDEAPRLERFVFRMAASDDGSAQAASACLEEALAGIEVDLRRPEFEPAPRAWMEPGIAALADGENWISHISLGLPQNYRIPGETGIYPQLLHELSVAIFDALLRGFCKFIAATSRAPPPHYRALGRSSFIAAARTVDRRIADIAAAFDFLLGVSPINSQKALEQFEAGRYDKTPTFRYRPLTVDPDVAKRRLFAIDLRRVEDPVLEALFEEKRRELDQQLTMLQCRNTPSFRYSSLMLYGPVEPALLDAAREILDRVPAAGEAASAYIGAEEIRESAREMVDRYRERGGAFAATISLREDIGPGLMVSGRRLLISTATRMRQSRLDALLQHEVSVHLLTYLNGNAQGLKIFRAGLAGYEGVQEGLGVFAECAVGGLTRTRLRLLAARVLVVNAMIDGAGFIDSFRLLHDDRGYSARGAFNIVTRVYRSGGLAKDAIYLRGFSQVLDMLAAGQELTPFWFGKIAARHVPVVEELALRGLLRLPQLMPEFLDRPEAQDRIAFMRTRPSLFQLI
jgi:uncharacterized protein (TIGR02421 family)